MFYLKAQKREKFGKKLKNFRKKGLLPAILYGPRIENQPLIVDLKEFEKVYKETGESGLIKLKIENEKREFEVLVHDIQKDPLTEKPIHVDFYQPRLEEEVEVTIPIIFEGEAPAVKDLGGTLVKNISELEVRALPKDLPKEIKVDIGVLKSFEDNILIKDLNLPQKIKILRKPDEIVASVVPPEEIKQ